MEEKNKPLGNCPFCEGQIVERDKNFACTNAKWEKNPEDKWENKGCGYSIYKSGLEKFGKKEITAAEVTDLLANGHTEVELISKKQIKINEKFGIQIEFK